MDTENINKLIQRQRIKTDNISDGYHTFGELYYHRAVLFAVVCSLNGSNSWKSKRHHDGTIVGDNWFVVGIDTPQGQYSYNYEIDKYWGLFNVKELEFAPKWDRHEPKDIERLLSLLIAD